MAARENQGLFIAVILLVLLSVVLAVATFFGFSGMREVADQRDSYQTDLKTEKAARAGFEAQAEVLEAIMGFEDRSIAENSSSLEMLRSAGNTELEARVNRILAEYEIDMAKAGAIPEDTDSNYRKTLDALSAVVAEKHVQHSVLSRTVADVELKMQTEIAAIQNQLNDKEDQLQKSREDLSNEQEAHALTRDSHTESLEEMKSAFQVVSSELDSTQTALSTAKSNFANEIEIKDDALLETNTRIAELTAIETDVADGQIVRVMPRLGKVILNLGSKDNLRAKQTFAVYDKQASAFKSGHGKATIEVIRVIDDHLAEARITSDNFIDPILTNDFIVTLTWDVGYSVPVAIAGRIDMDGDGESDLERFISIIQKNGFGKVVAWHDEDGKVTGEIDEYTRFFVKGDSALGKGSAGFKILDRQREQYQTREISMQDFLNEMGVAGEAKIQRFDNERQGGFVDRQPTTVEQGTGFDDPGNN